MMTGESYQLTFVGSILVIFTAIVLFIVALNLLASILRFLWRKVWGGSGSMKHSATQTNTGEGDHTMPCSSADDEPKIEVDGNASGGHEKIS